MTSDIWCGTWDKLLCLHAKIRLIPLGCAGYGGDSQDEVIEGFDMCCWCRSHLSNVLKVGMVDQFRNASCEHRHNEIPWILVVKSWIEHDTFIADCSLRRSNNRPKLSIRKYVLSWCVLVVCTVLIFGCFFLPRRVAHVILVSYRTNQHPRHPATEIAVSFLWISKKVSCTRYTTAIITCNELYNGLCVGSCKEAHTWHSLVPSLRLRRLRRPRLRPSCDRRYHCCNPPCRTWSIAWEVPHKRSLQPLRLYLVR